MSVILFSLLFSLLLIASLGSGNSDASPVNSANIILPMNYTAFPELGYAYKFIPNKLSWNSARKQCATEGANLVIVDSFKKIDHIMGLENNPFGIHTGVHRLFDSIEWISITNDQPLPFIPWKPDAKINAGTGECVAMWNDGSGVGPWNCENVLPSVCEIPITKGNNPEFKICHHGSIDRRINN